MFKLRCENPDTGQVWFRHTQATEDGANLDATDAKRFWPHLNFTVINEADDRPESERQILRCAPPFDAQAEHEADLRYESRVDAESWQYDGPAEREDV